MHALSLGADDYVTKPLRVMELQARISALLRRRPADPASRHGYRIDPANKRLLRDGQDLELSVMEFELARYLFEHAGELLSRDRLLTEVWDRTPEVDTRTVDAHVSRLRKKLGLGADNELQISTLRGYGYRLELAV